MLTGGCGEDAKQAFEFVIRRWAELYQNYRESLLLRCWGQRANSFHGLRIMWEMRSQEHLLKIGNT